MEQIEIQFLLNLPYSRENWISILKSVFNEVQIFNTNNVIEVNNPKVESFKLLGSVTLSDGKKLALLELKLHENVNIVRNRVELNNLVSQYIDFNSNYGVLSIFEQGSDDYRLTFSTKSVVYDENINDFVTRGTDSKRFTYLLGSNESCKTPAERLYNLSTNGNQINIEKVEEAFSVEKLSKGFFKEYQTHFNLFVDFIKGNDFFNVVFNADETAARNFVKVLFGRIVFIKFLQKKGWMGVPAQSNDWKSGNRHFLEEAFSNFPDKAHFHSKFLVPLFFDGLNRHRENDFFPYTNNKVPYLGGGLFFDEYPETHRIDFPETYFKDFFEFLEKYNFTIDENDPTEQEIGVDPEMLGHIFENLLEDNKDKGAFYTPKEIVHYMCRESLKEYLKTYLTEKNLWNEAEEQLDQSLSGLLNIKSVDEQLTPFCKELASALKNVKICDPAIGSGAFPMGLLNEIFHTVYTLFLKDNSIAELWEMDGWQPAKVKLNIIQNSIYGVDIEKGAVDIARLRFWLSLVVDEEVPQALPNLDYKIVVGNSLVSKLGDRIIDIDWNIRKKVGSSTEHVDSLKRNLEELVEKQREFFEHSDENLKLDIRNLKINILLSQLRLDRTIYANANVLKSDMGIGLKEKEIKKNEEIRTALSSYEQSIAELEMLLQNPELPLQFFDWKLDFPEVLNEQLVEKPGFDIVIGNPPYVSFGIRGVSKMSIEEKNILSKKYSNSAEYKISYYALFMELAISIASYGRVSNFIVPDSFLLGMYFSKIRNFILKKCFIRFIDLFTYKIFGNATVGFSVVYLLKNKSKNGVLSNHDIKCSKIVSQDMFTSKHYPCHFINSSYYKELNRNRFRLFFSKNDENLINKIENGSILLSDYYTGRTGIRSKVGQKNIISKEILNEKYFPVLTSSSQVKKFNIFYSDDFVHLEPDLLHSGGWEYEIINNPKILIPQTGDKITAAIDFSSFYHLNNIHSFAPHKNGLDLKFVCAILNSNLINWYYKRISLEEDRAMAQIDIETAEKIPIKNYNIESQLLIGIFVNEIISLKSQGNDTLALEQQIDNLVYRLYELTYDEVKIIEPEIEQRLSREEYEAIAIE